MGVFRHGVRVTFNTCALWDEAEGKNRKVKPPMRTLCRLHEIIRTVIHEDAAAGIGSSLRLLGLVLKTEIRKVRAGQASQSLHH